MIMWKKINVLGQLLILKCAQLSKYEVPKSSEIRTKLEYFSIFPLRSSKKLLRQLFYQCDDFAKDIKESLTQ